MRKFLLIVSIVLLSVSLQAQNGAQLDTNKIIMPEGKHPRVSQAIVTLLTRLHYAKVNIDDSLSTHIFDDYISTLDNNKMYFLKPDMESFETYRYMFDEFLYRGELSAAYEIFNTFKVRLTERINFIKKSLDNPYDFTINESFTPDREKLPWAKNKKELNEIWRKRLKNDALNLKLKGKEWDDIKTTLLSRYERFHKNILQYKAEDVFQLYMNALAEQADPHTSYFSPKTAEDFNINMSLSLEGIGAQLTSRDDYTTIVRIIPGGPADKMNDLFENDRIVGVAQGEEGDMVDVIGWRVDEVVELIRGKKGTKVRLNILRADDTPDMPTEEIEIIRDKVKLEDQAAKSKIFDVEENGINFKAGVIDVPTFYLDFEARRNGDPNYRSTTRDVKKLIDKLKKQGIDGLVIDLRNNGGGSLQEAIELTGLFIDNGPVVQVKNYVNELEIHKDEERGLYYDGPLVVLTNRYSASASEIFSAAIQDYERGIVVGEQSYGKGTVQNLMPLARYFKNTDEKFGELKMTIAKFYRVSGGSTQHLGVVPDIKFPTYYEASEIGESAKRTALPYDKIEPAKYTKYWDITPIIAKLELKHEKRIKDNLEFQYLMEDINEYNGQKNKKSFSLKESVRKLEREEEEARKKKREEEREKLRKLTIRGKDEVKAENIREEDPFLDETGRILADLFYLTNDTVAKKEKTD